jgi:hypothetical protein
VRGERGVRACIPGDDIRERVGHGFEEGARDAERGHVPERVAQTTAVLDRGDAFGASDADRHRSARVREQAQPVDHFRARARIGPRDDFVFGKRSEGNQKIVEGVGTSDGRRVEPLQAAFDGLHRVHVEESPEFRFAEEFPQLGVIERQDLRASLGERRVAFVDEVSDVGEKKRLGENGRPRRIDDPNGDGSTDEIAEKTLQRGEIEDVAEAFAHRFEHDRKPRELRRDREEIGGALPLLPERCAFSGPLPDEEQSAGGVFAKPCRKQGALAEFAHDESVESLHVREKDGGFGRFGGLRKTEHHSVVGPHGLAPGPRGVFERGGHRERPRAVHAGSERRKDAHAPVADLVEKSLDHDLAIGRNGTPVVALRIDVGAEGDGRRIRQGMSRPQSVEHLRPRRVRHRASEGADATPELVRTSDPVASPKRRLPDFAGRGRHPYAVVRDLVDPPSRGPEIEEVAGTRLEHHLLVEFSHPHGFSTVTRREEDTVEPAIGNRAAVDDRDAKRALTRQETTRRAIPREARA